MFYKTLLGWRSTLHCNEKNAYEALEDVRYFVILICVHVKRIVENVARRNRWWMCVRFECLFYLQSKYKQSFH